MKYHLTFRPDNTESQFVTVAGGDFQEMMAAFLREMLKNYGNCFLFAPMFEAMKEISDANDNGESKFDFNYCEFSDPESHFKLTFEVK